MPNWCYTKYRFQGVNEELLILKDKLEKWTNRNDFKKNAFGSGWLGNVLIGCMIDTGLCTEKNAVDQYDQRQKPLMEELDRQWKAHREGKEYQPQDDPDWLPYHRGKIVSDIEFNGSCELRLETETAWSETHTVFEWVIERLGLGVSCWYLAEERSNNYYRTNDLMGLIFDDECEFSVQYLLDGEDAGEGESEEYFSEHVNKQSFLNLCRSMLEEPISKDVSDEELDNLVSRMNKQKWQSEYSYCSVSRLKRKE